MVDFRAVRRAIVDGQVRTNDVTDPRSQCVGVHRPAARRARERVSVPDEVRWLWQACESVDAPLVPGAPRPYWPKAGRGCRPAP
jgi:hypothetical protein